jgi:hypothetical protein
VTPPDDRSGQYGVPYPGTGHDAFGAPGTGYGQSANGAEGRSGGGQQYPPRRDGRRWAGPGYDGPYDRQYGQEYGQEYPPHQAEPYDGGYQQPPLEGTAYQDSGQVPASYAEDFPDDYPDDENGQDNEPLIRPFAMTGGRTRPRYELAIEALVSSTASPERVATLLPEHQRICGLCREVKSVAEISALLTMPLGVARILVADLAETGLVAIHQPAAGGESGGKPDVTLLERVLSGLRKL